MAVCTIHCGFAGDSSGETTGELGGGTCCLRRMEPRQVRACQKLKFDLDALRASSYSRAEEETLIRQWTENVAEGNTLLLPDDQHLSGKTIFVQDEGEKNPSPTVYT